MCSILFAMYYSVGSVCNYYTPTDCTVLEYNPRVLPAILLDSYGTTIIKDWRSKLQTKTDAIWVLLRNTGDAICHTNILWKREIIFVKFPGLMVYMKRKKSLTSGSRFTVLLIWDENLWIRVYAQALDNNIMAIACILGFNVLTN